MVKYPASYNVSPYEVNNESVSHVCREFLELPAGDAGTSFRLLTSVTLLCRSPIIMTGSPRMKERPVAGLVEALNRIGGRIHYLENPGFPPLLVDGALKGGEVQVEGRVSSQYASSILLSAPYAESPVELELSPDTVSLSYIDVTADVMMSFGAGVRREGYERFTVEPHRPYGPAPTGWREIIHRHPTSLPWPRSVEGGQ